MHVLDQIHAYISKSLWQVQFVHTLGLSFSQLVLLHTGIYLNMQRSSRYTSTAVTVRAVPGYKITNSTLVVQTLHERSLHTTGIHPKGTWLVQNVSYLLGHPFPHQQTH